MKLYLKCKACGHCWAIISQPFKVDTCVKCQAKDGFSMEMGSGKSPEWFEEKPKYAGISDADFRDRCNGGLGECGECVMGECQEMKN